MAIIINIDVMLAKRKMSVTELSEKVGITMANISILKNGKAKAIKVDTLNKICRALDCQPGDILEYVPSDVKFNILHGMKQEQDSLLEKEGSMKMDQNLTVSYEEQKAQWQERKKQQQKENAGFLKNLCRQASFTH